MATFRHARIAAVLIVFTALTAGGVVAWRRHVDRLLSDTITHPAPELGPRAHVLIANLRGARVVVPDRPHDPAELRLDDRFQRIKRMRTFEVDTNSQGLRGPEFQTPAPGFRIVCIGDSVTFGWGVPWEESYPARLGEILGVEVLDGGTPAMDPTTIAAWFSARASDLDPDLVLFTRRPAAGTEGLESFAHAVRATVEAARGVPVGIVMPPVSTFDVRGSMNWEYESRELTERLAPLPVLELTPIFRAALPLPGVVLESDGEVQRMVRLPDRKVLVEATAPEHGLAPAIVAAFEADHDVAEPLFYDGGHPDTAGFQLFAGSVANWVREQGWVPAH